MASSPFTKTALELQRIAESTAKDRRTVQEGVNKLGLGEDFTTNALTATNADIETLSALVVEVITQLEVPDIIGLLKLRGPLEFAAANLATATTRTMTHDLGYVPFWVSIQRSTNGTQWVPIVDDVNWDVTITSTAVNITNNTGATQQTRGLIIG